MDRLLTANGWPVLMVRSADTADAAVVHYLNDAVKKRIANQRLDSSPVRPFHDVTP